jgi:hypothetical protein
MRTDCFTDTQLAPLRAGRTGRAARFDIEGLAIDPEGRLYLCDESRRWILRCDPRQDRVERLTIDWTPVQPFFADPGANAAFEGIAVGDGRLYLANERAQARLIVVDLATLRVVDHFVVRPAAGTLWEPHYSDLCWFAGRLYVLLREARCVLAIDARSHRVTAEYDYRALEADPEHDYIRALPFAGLMEGLAVDDTHLWLVTDNNDRPRVRDLADRRPTLFRCPRPDAAARPAAQFPSPPD